MLTRALFFVLIVAVPATAESPMPTLTDVQKLSIRTLALTLENYQLRAQQAEGELRRYLDSLKVPGYRLELGSLTYVAEESPP